jgi:putative nucleotidyltransferase with HDIG domain
MTHEVYSSYFDIFADISKSIHSGINTSDILNQIVSGITKITDSKGTIFWIVNPQTRTIENKISHGFDYRSLSLVSFDTLSQIFDPLNREDIFIRDARYDERIPDLERLGKKRVGSINGFFFEIDSNFLGILAVYFTQFHKLSDDEIKLVKALGEQGAISLQKALYYDEKTIEHLRQFIEGLVLALEAKDKKTHGHSIKVAQLARVTANAMDLPKKEMEMIYHGALLHDIGKLGIENLLLEKLGILDDLEMDIVKKHPAIGTKIIQPLTFLKGIEPFILYHHEKFDGSGYPMGLKKEQIPLGARIISVCDAFETMLSGRENIKKKTFPDSVTTLKKKANIHFDPSVVKALFKGILTCPDQTGCPDLVKKHQADLICEDIDEIARTNFIRRQFCSNSTGFF